jgi:hypothetical protein
MAGRHQGLTMFLVDMHADGTAEKIRYEWSGTPGDPLRKTVAAGAAPSAAMQLQLAPNLPATSAGSRGPASSG